MLIHPIYSGPLLLALSVFATNVATTTTTAAPAYGVDKSGLQVVEAANSHAPADGFSFVKLEHGVQLRIRGQVKNVMFYGPGIVRVNTTLGKNHTTQPSLTVVAKPPVPQFTVDDKGSLLQLSSAGLVVQVDKKSGAITYLKPDSTVITRENSAEPATLKEMTISGEPTYEVKQNFTLSDDESLYGLGQYDERYMDYRGKKVLLVQTNIGIVVPLLVSTRRYGIMWDIYSKTIFNDDLKGASFWAESAPAGVDYYFIAGNNMDGVIEGYRYLTGKAPMFPKSAFGLFMSKERYQTQQRLIDVTREFRSNGISIDNIVQDWQYWGGNDGSWSGMIWDKDRFPDPKALTRTLHDELHVKLMNSIWPSVGDDTALAKELDKYKLRHEPLHWISKKARIYDAYSAKGRQIYFKHIKNGLLDAGVDALWMDGTEVEVDSACHDAAKVESDIKGLGKNAMGDYTRYLNTYTLVTTKGTYEGQRATNNKRVFTLTRSAFLGQQRNGALSWSGDTTSSWEELRDQISGGVNVAMAGQPYWTQDTGGFFVGGNWRNGGSTTPEYNELFARWHQFGAFNPVYRIHGTDIDRELYLFKDRDPEVFRSLMAANRLRYRLMPYIYSLAWKSTDQGYTMMRGLPMDFPDDLAARKLDDQFIFGPAFLVHPVTQPMFRVPPPPVPTILAGSFTTPDGQPGIAVQYFHGRNFDKVAGTMVAPMVDETWPGPPLTDLPKGLTTLDEFSDRWEATLTIPTDGEFEIGVEGDDGVRLWLDGKLIVDDWGIHPMRWRGQKFNYHRGQKVAVKIEHFQGGLNRGLRMGWKVPGAPVEITDNDIVESYLPAGAAWYDFWSNELHQGGQTVKQSTPLDQIPLFVRAGSIVPMSPVMQYVTEMPAAPYEIRIYPGADATFTIYEDDNETYNYEKGQCATVDLVWDDASRTLAIGNRKGAFPGMTESREFRVVIMAPENGPGIPEVEIPDKTFLYVGKETSLKF